MCSVIAIIKSISPAPAISRVKSAAIIPENPAKNVITPIFRKMYSYFIVEFMNALFLVNPDTNMQDNPNTIMATKPKSHMINMASLLIPRPDIISIIRMIIPDNRQIKLVVIKINTVFIFNTFECFAFLLYIYENTIC